MSDLMFSGKDSFIAMACTKSAGIIGAMDAMISQVTGGIESQAPGAANVGFGAGVDLGGFGGR